MTTSRFIIIIKEVKVKKKKGKKYEKKEWKIVENVAFK